MKRTVLTVLVVALAGLGATASGRTQGSTTPDARVESIATMVGSLITIFEFDLYNCPEGAEMAVDLWNAEQPDRPPGTGASSGLQPFGPSTGQQVQHLTLQAEGNFLAGLPWVGRGFVSCGPVVIPVEGSGTTKSQNGV